MAKNQPAFGYLYISPGVSDEYCKLLKLDKLFGPPLVTCELPEVPLFDGTILTQNATNYVTDNNIYDASVHFGTGGPVSSYSLQGNPAWLQIVSSTGILFGTPDASGDTAGITVVGSNAAGSAVSNPFTMSVAANPPIFSGTIPNYEFEEGLAITPTDLSGYFTAGGPVVAYSLQNAPAWLNIDPVTGIVTGTPNTGDDYTNVTVTGTNADGSAVSNTFDITVTDALAPPTFIGNIPNIAGYIGLPIEAYDASVDFSGQVGTYSLIGNPAWLQINPSTGLLTGTPDVLGTHNNIRVRATNAAGSADSNLFSTTVSEILPIFSRNYTGVDIGADAVYTRASNASLLDSDGRLITVPDDCARLWKSRTVFNLFGDVGNSNKDIVSSETLSVWVAYGSATIEPDNRTFNFAAIDSSRIDSTWLYTSQSIDYFVGRTYSFTVALSGNSGDKIRLSLYQGATAKQVYKEITLQSETTVYTIKDTVENGTTSIRPILYNATDALAKTDIYYHWGMFEDITGREQNISDIIALNGLDAWTPYNNNTEEADPEGGVRFNYVDYDGGAYGWLTVADGTMQSDIVLDTDYYLEFECKHSAGADNIQVSLTSNEPGGYQESIAITTDTYTKYVMPFNMPFYGNERPYIRFQGLTAGEWVAIRNIRIYEEVAPSEYVSYGVESGPVYHGLYADAVKAFPFNLESFVDRDTGEVTYGTGTTPIVAEGLLMEPAATNEVPNSWMDVPGAGGADVLAYWNEVPTGSSEVKVIDLSLQGFTKACSLDFDGSSSQSTITQSPINRASVVAGDILFFSVLAKKTGGAGDLAVQIRADEAGANVRYFGDAGWSDTVADKTVALTGDWQRLEFATDPVEANKTRAWLHLLRRTAGSSPNESIQFTDLRFSVNTPISSIRTEGTAVSRAVDTLQYPLTTPQTQGAVVIRMRFGVDYDDAPENVSSGIISFNNLSTGVIVSRNPLGLFTYDGTNTNVLFLNWIADKEYYIGVRWTGLVSQLGYRNATDGGTWVWDTEKPYDGAWRSDNIISYFLDLAYPNTVALTEVYDVDPGTAYLEGKY